MRATSDGLLWYFAYGSNMQTATLRGRRQVDYRRALPGRVRGWRLALDKPPLVSVGGAFANIIEDMDAEVLGVLYEINEDDLAHIELTEGVVIGNYCRVIIPAVPIGAPDHDGVTAFSLTSDRRDVTLQPTERYMSLIIDGAIEHGLPAEYVAALRRIPTCPETEVAAQLRPLIDEFMRRR